MAGLYDGTNAPTVELRFLATFSPSIPGDDIANITMYRGRSNPLNEAQAGTLTVLLDNVSGDYDPDNGASSWAPILQAGAQAQLIATWDTVEYTLMHGWLESVEVNHSNEPTVQLNFTDAVGRISGIPITAMPDALYDTDYDDEPVYNASTATGRLARLFDAGVYNFADTIEISGSMLRKMTPIRSGSTFTQILNECAILEGARWYISRENALAYYSAYDQGARSTILNLSDSRDLDTVEYDVLQVAPGAALLTNDCRLSIPGRNSNDIEYWAQYDASVSDYGIRSVKLSAPIYNADWAKTLAMFYARRYAVPKSYVSRVEFSAQALDTLYPALLAAELMDVLNVERTTVDGRLLTWDCVIEGIGYSMTPGSWRVAFDTSPLHGFYPSMV